MRPTLAVPCLAIVFAASVARGDTGVPAGPVLAETVEVAGSRLGAEIRAVTVIGADEIARLPVTDTVSALSYAAGLDLRSRAPFGAQADASLNGSGFEGVMVLVDGFVVSDPQTGHHLLEFLPPLSAIDHIEVLTGPAAAVWGPGAFGGVLQIVTKKPPAAGTVRAAGAGGQNGLYRGEVYAAGAGASLAASRLVHGGYRPDTDLSDTRAMARAAKGGFDAILLWQDKSFGAWQAYSDAFPNEWEQVRGVAGRVQWTGGGWQLDAGLRHKRDEFLLDRARPAFYDAVHTVDAWSGHALRRFRALGGAALAGIDVADDRIASNTLGDHARGRGGLFLEGHWLPGAFELDAGLRAERLGGRTWMLPQVAVGRRLGPGWRAFASVGRAVRLPSFTELYTRSAAWDGDPSLAPEEAWGYEAGVRGSAGPVTVTVKVFRRDGRNVIDFVRPEGSGVKFFAANIQDQRTDGLEVAGDGALGGGLSWSAGATFLGSSVTWPAGIESRYVGDTLRHRETAALSWRDADWTTTLAVRSGQRENRAAHAEIDALVARSLAGGHISVSVECRNLLDRPDTNFFGGELPGRWVWAGVTLQP